MPETRERINRRLREFLDATERVEIAFNGRSNTIRDLGLESDEGLDFVLDLCDEFDFDFPAEFNPIVHECGRRGRSVDELVHAVDSLLVAGATS